MNRASFLIQELLGLRENGSDASPPPQKQINDEQGGGPRPCCKRSREDADSVGEEINPAEGS